MSNKNVFSTKREEVLTGEQMLENAIKRRQMQRENMRALTEARKLNENVTDFTATMESANLDAEREAEKSIALENAYYAQGAKNIVKEQLHMKSRLIQEGMEQVYDNVLGQIIYESYWLDNPVKESTVNQIEDSVGQILVYIEDKCPDCKVPVEKQTKLLKNIHSLIESVVKEAADRIVKEAEEINSAFSEFELNNEEEEKLDNELRDLGKDEIVELIRDKVAQVIQDERTRGKERSETFNEIDQELKANEEDEAELADGDVHTTDGKEVPDDTDEEATEATLIGIENGEITLEGATWETLKVIFSNDKKDAKSAYKNAARLVKRKKYKEAAKEYAEAKKIFEKMKSELNDVDENTMSTVCGFLLSGWLEHLFIASLGGPASGTSITKALLIALSGSIGISIPIGVVMQLSQNEENTRKNASSYSTNDYKVHTIAALDLNIKACSDMIRECNSKANKKTSLKEALTFDVTDGRYTANERYISRILENGASFNTFEDPSWNEFKSCISLLCKKAKNILMVGSPDCYCAAIPVIDELMNRLSNVPENVPGDVKAFVLTMVSTIYGTVPADEVIISRLGRSFGSPDLSSNSSVVNYETISWMDVLVNIKTNLSSVKSYCEAHCVGHSEPDNITTDVTPKATLESLIARKQNQIMNRNIGSTLFESIMIGNLANTDKVAMESSQKFEGDEIEDAALIESLLHYTVFETLDTLGIYKFRLNDIKGIKKDYIQGVTEGKSPIYGDSDSQTMSHGRDKKGKKKIRINTRKMKPNKDKVKEM